MSISRGERHGEWDGMMPIRASIGGPPFVDQDACIAACHSGALCSAFGSFVIFAGILERDQLAAAGQRDRFVEMTRPVSHRRARF
jgi:hypothetical protein